MGIVVDIVNTISASYKIWPKYDMNWMVESGWISYPTTCDVHHARNVYHLIH